MLFAPVRLGSTALSAEVLTADVKNCKHFGPCGVGEKALYLNGFLFDRHYYVALGDIRRVFKRVAMSKGGFTGNGVFGAIPYLVVEYGDGTQKQCTFKREDNVDDLLAYLAKVCPGLPLHSVQAEQRLARKAQEEAVRYLDVLTPEAQAAREKLEKARTFLAGYPKLTDRLSTAAKAKRVNEHTNPAHKWVALAIVLVARPSQVDAGDERASSRDIALCLDVSGSTLPYDREVIDTYLELVKHFKGERIGLSIFNSTSRTVFPLTDDYELVTKQLTSASKALKGVESQDDIDKMSDAEYQDIANWLEGTQNRKDATYLIGDGVVSCAAMLPGFAYGEANHANADRQRAASIVLATDNVVSGKPTYSLTEALDLTQQTKITVDGLYSGPKASESDQTTTDMKSAIESHGGIFLTQSNGASIDELVRDIQSRRDTDVENKAKSSMVDAPGLWTLALAVILIIWIVCAWRLRR